MQNITKTFVSSRDPNVEYTAEIRADGFVSCNCPGFTHRQTCKHVEQLKADAQQL